MPILFKVINIALIIVNAVMFFLAQRKPMNNLNASGAGILALFALIIMGVWLVHLMLTGVALYFNKTWLLQVIAVLMVPASFVFWYYAVQMIKP